MAFVAPEMMPGNGFSAEVAAKPSEGNVAPNDAAAAAGAARPAPRLLAMPAPKPAFKPAAFKCLTGTATGTGKMIGDFFKFFRILAPAANLATFKAFAAFRPATLSANAFFTLRNGAVMKLSAAIFDALIYPTNKKNHIKLDEN